MLENASSQVAFADSTLTEWEFITRMAADADCGLLLDVSNVSTKSCCEPAAVAWRVGAKTRLPAKGLLSFTQAHASTDVPLHKAQTYLSWARNSLMTEHESGDMRSLRGR